MNRLAIIPARGGSKRIPGKNIKDFLGKPIIAYSIIAAQNSGLFNEIMVSTDNNKIAETAKKYGAKVPFMRSAEQANDYAPLSDVVVEVLKDYKAKLQQEFDYIACILPTSPLIQPRKIAEAFTLLLNKKYKSVTAVIPFSYPVMRALEFSTDQHLKMKWPEYSTTRSQDLLQLYHDAGMFYWLETHHFLKEQKMFSEKGTGIVLDETECQDIDTETDWKLAELKYKALYG